MAKRADHLSLLQYANLIAAQVSSLTESIAQGTPVTSLDTFKGYPISWVNGYKDIVEHPSRKYVI